MIKLELINPTNAAVFKNIRLRALQDSPNAFSSTYAEELTLTDADWLKRAAQWSSATSVAYLAMDSDAAVGIAAGVLDRNDPLRADLMSMWVSPTHRRQCVGHMLVDAVVAWARAQNVLHLYLNGHQQQRSRQSVLSESGLCAHRSEQTLPQQSGTARLRNAAIPVLTSELSSPQPPTAFVSKRRRRKWHAGILGRNLDLPHR